MAYQDLILKALDTTTDAIYLVDRASMAIIYANDAACRLSDMSREQLIAAGPAGALGVPNPQIEKVFDGINALIVRARTLKELFEAACRIAGKEGGFPMTFIAMQDPETRNSSCC